MPQDTLTARLGTSSKCLERCNLDNRTQTCQVCPSGMPSQNFVVCRESKSITMDSDFSNIDVVNGRGQGAQRLPGNVMFRKLVSAHKRTYAQAPKSHKVPFAQGIVIALRRFGAKFLEFDTNARCYSDIGDEKAVIKTGTQSSFFLTSFWAFI